MHRFARPVAVFAASSVISLTVLHVADANRPVPAATGNANAAVTQGGYALPELQLLRATLDRVRTQYVEPERIDPAAMYLAALEAVEHLVPEALFRLDGDRLSVRLASWRGVLVVPPVRTLDDVERELERVTDLVVRHLPATAVPVLDEMEDPFAPVEYAMTNGVLQTLDPHSLLLPPQESREMDNDNRGEFGGLGMTLRTLDGLLTITDLMPGTPAARSGLARGDVLRRIDGEPTINLGIDEAVDLLRGHVGEPVVLEIARDGADLVSHRLVRENIRPNEVRGQSMGDGLAYVRFRAFHVNVATELESVLRRLSASAPIEGLVLDLRDNPGGYLDKAVDVADRFLSEGELVSTRGPLAGGTSRRFAHDDGSEGQYPVVVLVNANSASASEVVAGALRNNERAVIVGERTFGKGSVQNLLSLGHASKLKITIAQYLTPGERSIQSAGIPADIEILPVYSEVGSERDVVLYGREDVRREADLHAHLVGKGTRHEEPVYTLTYVQPWDDDDTDYDDPDVQRDRELAFALDLLRAAPSAHRPEMLAAAGPLVERYAAASDEALGALLAPRGVAWRAGPTAPSVTADDLPLAVSFEHGDQLLAGRSQAVTLTVTNTTDAPLHRIAAVFDDHEVLGGTEFLFGTIAPGATATSRRQVDVWAGYPSEISEASVSLRSDHQVLTDYPVAVEVAGSALPSLQWRWKLASDGPVDVGDRVTLTVDVDNVGEGPTAAASARIRNRSGTALDIHVGTLAIGSLQTPAGESCDATGPECSAVLPPGGHWSGSFELELLEPVDTYEVLLSLEDVEAYDHATISRSGFYDYGRLEDRIRFGAGDVAVSTDVRRPPVVELGESPDAVLDTDVVTLSGRATDDNGIEHVMVFLDDEKIAFQGADTEGLRSVPFTATTRIAPGTHTLSVLVKDTDGYAATTSRVVFRPPEEPAVLAENLTPP